MARNTEKAQHTLNRYVQGQREELQGPRATRPYLASECESLSDAEKWRMEIVREVGKKVSMIQNEGLAEHKIRDLNDGINKSLREKFHWEKRIKELGGPDHMKTGPKLDDDTSLEVVPGKGGGYRYFGAAKNLPGVRELFIKAPAVRPKRTRAQITKGLDADYYGYRDDDDGVLAELEVQTEQRLRKEALRRWRQENPEAASGGDADFDGLAAEGGFRAHVSLPSDKEIEKAILQRRKQELLAKYLSSEAE
ncbi:Isy1-like splicing factor [Pavlovales sp. CCMP2436]|nr:Isy1-like splicing factor [Pavlovales sp. CCMP2436]|mmetsp:Transcript_22305/g.56554  ORF Transcript_22305/g.56554 Transcript_22305/m.56554 type:complete len:251 (+) Transcript_22305:45-797(+)